MNNLTNNADKENTMIEYHINVSLKECFTMSEKSLTPNQKMLADIITGKSNK
jgi:hypothetical protein